MSVSLSRLLSWLGSANSWLTTSIPSTFPQVITVPSAASPAGCPAGDSNLRASDRRGVRAWALSTSAAQLNPSPHCQVPASVETGFSPADGLPDGLVDVLEGLVLHRWDKPELAV